MYRFVKRFLDIIISLIAIIVLSPILLVLSILVGIFNGWPIIFKQPRPGKNGKIFMMYKFRSMTNKCDANGDLLPDSKRITPLGKFIRATSLDELPQFFNILKGDMSLVGPRPRLIKDAIFYPDEAKALTVRPGITCLAHINGRNNNTWESVFIYDNIYVKKMSFKLDVKILFKTVSVVLKRTGTNDGTQDLQDYYYADYLLRVGKINRDEYNQGITRAKHIEQEFVASKKFRKGYAMAKALENAKEYDLEEKTVD